MQPVPRIFVSATSRDLRTARGLVSEGLRRMECLPIVQDDFPPDYKSVREMLRTKLETCNAVVHLAGFYYGAEPQPVLDGPERRSFTQMEYEIAVELGLPCYVFLCGERFPFDEHAPEPEDKRELQVAHRGRLLERDELYYEFDSREDLNSRTRELQLSVESLRDELAKERARRRLTLVVAAAALLVAVAGGVFLYAKSQSQEAVIAEAASKLDAQGALIAQLLAEQERLRLSITGGEADVVALAEANVAEARGQTVAEVRDAVAAEIEAAAQALAAARESGDRAGELSALLRVAAAEQAMGRTTEEVAAYVDYLALVDRESEPVAWAEVTALTSAAEKRRRPLAEAPEALFEAVEWATGEPRLGAEHPATLELMTVLAGMVPPDEAVGLRERVAAAREKTFGADDLRAVQARLSLAQSLVEAESFEEADALLENVIAAWERTEGPGGALTLQARGSQAVSLQKQGVSAEAAEMLRDIIRLADEEFGVGNRTSDGFYLRLALLHDEAGDAEAEIATYREALSAVERGSRPESERAVYLSGMLANALVGNDEYEAAEPLARRVVAARIREIGVGQAATISAMKTLTWALEGQGKIDEFAVVMREMIAARTEAFGPDDPRIADENLLLGVKLLGAEQLDAANEALEASYDLRVRLLGENHADMAQSADFRTATAFKADDWPAVELWSRRALVAYETNDELDPSRHVEALFTLALALEELGENGEALELARRVVAMSADLPADDRNYLESADDMMNRLEPSPSR